jgi:amidophosphoribosyltransferase
MAGLKDKCGIAGVYGINDCFEILYLSLLSLQHRGEESCGMLVSDGKNINFKRGMGLAGEVFSSGDAKKLCGSSGIAHNRYSTTGSSSVKNIQPFIVDYKGKTYAIAHNGNIVNSSSLRKKLEDKGTIFQTTLDTEIIMHLISRSKKKNFADKLKETLKQLKGAFSIVLFTPDKIIGMRDPWGFRPLCLGKLKNGYILASESCAFDLAGAEYIREIEPGEILSIGKEGIKSSFLEKKKISRCIFEFIYFARPDSKIFGKSVYLVRKNLGEKLAEEFPFDGDMVIPIPDSGNIAAVGFARQKGLPFELGIVRNHYMGRTFIQPLQHSREAIVKIKLNPIGQVIKNKEIIVIEDSIVRGTTSKLRIKNLRAAGAKKIYMGVTCPPIKYPCFYGIDFPSQEELIASQKSIKDIEKELNLDGLYYLSLEGMLSSISLPAKEFCTACFTKDYRVKPREFKGKEQFE